MVKIFRQLEGNEELVAGADPGEGVSYCAGIYISRKYKDIPITYHPRVESPQVGYELNNIGFYVLIKTGNTPLLAVERNIGQATIQKLLDLGYPSDKLYRQATFDRVTRKRELRIGFVTSASNRRKMLDELAMDVRNKLLKIYDEEIVSEMMTFVINERTNEPRPESGRFSDMIMATAIANQMLREVVGVSTWAPHSDKAEDKKFIQENINDKLSKGLIIEAIYKYRSGRVGSLSNEN